MRRRSREYGWCPECGRMVRLTKGGRLHRHGFSFMQRGLGRSRVRVDVRPACAGGGQKGEPIRFEWTPERRDIRRRIEGACVNDRDVEELVAEGFSEDDVLGAMSELGYTIGKAKDGSNEWWPPERKETG